MRARRPASVRSLLAVRHLDTWTWKGLLRSGPALLGSMALHGLLLLLSLHIVFSWMPARTPFAPITVPLRPPSPPTPGQLLGGGAGPAGEARGFDPLLEKGNNRLIDEDPATFPDLPPPERMKPGERPSAATDAGALPIPPPYRPEKISLAAPDPAAATSPPAGATAIAPEPGATGDPGGGGKPLGLKTGESVGGVLRGNLRRNRPGDDSLLDGLSADEVVVTTGVYDAAQRVLDKVRIPYTLRSPRQLDAWDLARTKVVLVNCPGYLGQRSLDRLRAWVRAGGYLFTTDWSALVVERAFFGHIQSLGKTHQDWVAVSAVEEHKGDPLLEDVFTRLDGAPHWWLESGSFAIKVLKPEAVTVLIASREMELKYGYGTIATVFDMEKGRVLHVASHFDQASGDAKAHFSMSQLIVNYVLAAKKAANARAAEKK
ncbi:MAG: hypothetical protein HZA54_01515 [Planctomycetes bacterium]|nr:hypothetical protein [Planctomycetota bacterium]